MRVYWVYGLQGSGFRVQGLGLTGSWKSPKAQTTGRPNPAPPLCIGPFGGRTVQHVLVRVWELGFRV